MNEWVSVNDKLPSEEYDWVLVSVVDCKNPKLRFVPMVAERRKGKWSGQEDVEADLEAWNHVKVTHWMPLPDAPKD